MLVLQGLTDQWERQTCKQTSTTGKEVKDQRYKPGPMGTPKGSKGLRAGHRRENLQSRRWSALMVPKARPRS